MKTSALIASLIQYLKNILRTMFAQGAPIILSPSKINQTLIQLSKISTIGGQPKSSDPPLTL